MGGVNASINETVAGSKGLQGATIPAKTEQRQIIKKIVEEIDIDTKAVVVSHVQFSTGTKLDYHLVGEAAQKHDALFILDVTQSAGAIPLNFGEISADALISSGYKWLGGHGGAAFAIL